MSLVCGSCTQNNGYIGDLFGSWSLQEMTENSEVVRFPADTYFTLSFQGDVAMFTLASDRHDYLKRYCLFTHEGSSLTFTFDGPETNDSPVLLLGFDSQVEETTITKLDSKNLSFTRTNTDGSVFNYIFKRTW